MYKTWTMEFLKQIEFSKSLIASGVLAFCLVLLRIFLIGIMRQSKEMNRETRRLWTGRISTFLMIFLIIGLSFIWADQIRAFAYSMVAVAAAMVIATKELILCLLGGLLKSFSRPFRIGDRIEIGIVRGDVLRHDIFTTTLLEIGPGKSTHQYTGKEVTVPNSLLLSNPLINESAGAPYGLHSFTLSFPINTELSKLRTVLLDTANAVCKPIIEKAQSTFDRLSEHEDIDAPNAEPRLAFSFPAPDRVDVVMRVPVPVRRSGKVEQEIIDLLVANNQELFKKQDSK